MSDDLSRRTDIRPVELAGRDAYDALCLHCGRCRGTWSAELLPEPGLCPRCRVRSPRDYWTRDWARKETDT